MTWYLVPVHPSVHLFIFSTVLSIGKGGKKSACRTKGPYIRSVVTCCEYLKVHHKLVHHDLISWFLCLPPCGWYSVEAVCPSVLPFPACSSLDVQPINFMLGRNNCHIKYMWFWGYDLWLTFDLGARSLSLIYSFKLFSLACSSLAMQPFSVIFSRDQCHIKYRYFVGMLPFFDWPLTLDPHLFIHTYVH